MNPHALILTALLLGAFVSLAGIYGVLYSFAELRGSRSLLGAARASYAMACVVSVLVVAFTPLGPAWKLLIVLSTAAYLFIPPMTWRYLTKIHGEEEFLR